MCARSFDFLQDSLEYKAIFLICDSTLEYFSTCLIELFELDIINYGYGMQHFT